MPQKPHGPHATVHAYCVAKPFTVEVRLRGETLFKTRGRVFAFMNLRSRPAVTVRATRFARRQLLRHPAIVRATMYRLARLGHRSRG